ncbi:MAG: hypothetical protein ACYDBV_08360 [Nitrospiria bacterium]
MNVSLEWIKRLGKRERRVLQGGTGFLLLLGVWLFIFSPVFEKMSWYDKKSLQKEKDLVEMGRVKEEYLKLKTRLDRFDLKIGQGKKDFSFPAYLEGLAAENQLKNKMTSLSPLPPQSFENIKMNNIEIKLENITLIQAVAFLSRIESSPSFLYIKQLHMKTRYSEQRNLDVTFIVSHYEKTL